MTIITSVLKVHIPRILTLKVSQVRRATIIVMGKEKRNQVFL